MSSIFLTITISPGSSPIVLTFASRQPAPSTHILHCTKKSRGLLQCNMVVRSATYRIRNRPHARISTCRSGGRVIRRLVGNQKQGGGQKGRENFRKPPFL